MTKLIRSILLSITFCLLTGVLPLGALRAQEHRPASSAGLTQLTPEIRGLLSRLDSLLAGSDFYVLKKEEQIKRLRENYRNASDAEHRYWRAADLYDQYSAYDSDSALHYAAVALSYARDLGRRDLIDEMQLNRSYVLSATGLLDEARRCLVSLSPDSLPPHLAVKYCDRMLFLSTHRDQYIGGNDESKIYTQKVDSVLRNMMRIVKPGDPQYAWLRGWSCLTGNGDPRQVTAELKKLADVAEYTSREDAMNAWMLSQLYEITGDRQNRLKYLILSAMADIRACNKEIASLEELASLLYDMGEYDKANAYVNRSLAYANEYKSRVRLGDLAKLQEQILGAIHTRAERQAAANRWYLGILILILCVLVGAIFYIMRQNTLLRKSRATLNEANAELSRRVEELQTIREELNTTNAKLKEMYSTASGNARELAEVNESKEAYIANIFTICSNYIDKLEDFRANINKLLTSRQFDQALQLVKSPELSYSEVKELCTTFDNIFIQIYPGFVDDFNSLLRPEERIELKEPTKLNTELRIYALVRLGMNDSVRIAKFLHCSVQTVYNTRQRTRNKAVVPREEFAKAVMALGKKS